MGEKPPGTDRETHPANRAAVENKVIIEYLIAANPYAEGGMELKILQQSRVRRRTASRVRCVEGLPKGRASLTPAPRRPDLIVARELNRSTVPVSMSRLLARLLQGWTNRATQGRLDAVDGDCVEMAMEGFRRVGAAQLCSLSCNRGGGESSSVDRRSQRVGFSKSASRWCVSCMGSWRRSVWSVVSRFCGVSASLELFEPAEIPWSER
jgi:hypothetical protein